jgi:hypothetical protein
VVGDDGVPFALTMFISLVDVGEGAVVDGCAGAAAAAVLEPGTSYSASMAV